VTNGSKAAKAAHIEVHTLTTLSNCADILSPNPPLCFFVSFVVGLGSQFWQLPDFGNAGNLA
jgi:hypothetical protein